MCGVPDSLFIPFMLYIVGRFSQIVKRRENLILSVLLLRDRIIKIVIVTIYNITPYRSKYSAANGAASNRVQL